MLRISTFSRILLYVFFMYTSSSVCVFYTICWLFQMSSERFVGFADGASHHTCNLASATWVIYSPLGQLVASGGTFLGPASNNVAEYTAVIELLWDALSRGITQLEFRLASQLVVSQLNRAYQVWNLFYYVSLCKLGYQKEILSSLHSITFQGIKIH